MLLGAWAAVGGGVWIGVLGEPASGRCCSISAPICLRSHMGAAPGPDLAGSRLSGMVLAQHRQPGWKKGVGWMMLDG